MGTLAETKAGLPVRAMVMPTPAEELVKEPSQRISHTMGRRRVAAAGATAGVDGATGSGNAPLKAAKASYMRASIGLAGSAKSETQRKVELSGRACLAWSVCMAGQEVSR